VTERTNPMSWPASDEDTFQPMPERTLCSSGKFVVSVISSSASRQLKTPLTLLSHLPDSR
jgi:hypothetical protein